MGNVLRPRKGIPLAVEIESLGLQRSSETAENFSVVLIPDYPAFSDDRQFLIQLRRPLARWIS
jgi:hypothetical protein